MNWRLIFQLSLFGLAMAFATVFWIPSKFEWVFWLVIFIFCAYMIVRNSVSKFFLNGFMVSIFNCIWIIIVHVAFYNTYMANHPEMAQMNANMPLANSPRLQMIVTGPVIGVVMGLILGLFASIASKIMRKPSINS